MCLLHLVLLGLTGGTCENTAKKQLMKCGHDHFRRYDCHSLVAARDGTNIPDTGPTTTSAGTTRFWPRATAPTSPTRGPRKTCHSMSPTVLPKP